MVGKAGATMVCSSAERNMASRMPVMIAMIAVCGSWAGAPGFGATSVMGPQHAEACGKFNLWKREAGRRLECHFLLGGGGLALQMFRCGRRACSLCSLGTQFDLLGQAQPGERNVKQDSPVLDCLFTLSLAHAVRGVLAIPSHATHRPSPLSTNRSPAPELSSQ